MLPDVALLEIFDFYGDGEHTEAWRALVHVCQKWRNVVFGSPHRLDLRLFCTARSPVREMLDVWPQFPIFISVNGQGRHEPWGAASADNLIAALEQNDRICRLDLNYMPHKQLGKLLPAMEQPFPALTRLKLQLRSRTSCCVPDLLLGGSAPPHLQTLILDQIRFPGLPKLLLSATHLVHLRLWRMSHREFISPGEMATFLSVLTRLERLEIGLDCCFGRESQSPPQRTRTLLHVLKELRFSNAHRYLEDLTARIDAPLLHKFILTSHQSISDSPRLNSFICRTPKFQEYDAACMVFFKWSVWVTFSQMVDGRFEPGLSCGVSNLGDSSQAWGCVSSIPRCLIPAVEHLYIQSRSKRRWDVAWKGDDASIQWQKLLRPFIAARYLYISRPFVSHIASAMQKSVGESETEVLPALQTIYFEEPLPSGPNQKAIEQFTSARLLAGHPIAVSLWENVDKPDWPYGIKND